MGTRFLFNVGEMKSRRKCLRKKQTDAEKLLWFYLRNKKWGIKFFRQYSVGVYILDFYCPEVKLAIELDGVQHSDDENKIYDDYRTRYLTAVGIKVVRFWNNEVLTKIDSVLELIWKELGNAPSDPPLNLRGGRGS